MNEKEGTNVGIWRDNFW